MCTIGCIYLFVVDLLVCSTTVAVPNTAAVVRGLRKFIYIHSDLLQLII